MITQNHLRVHWQLGILKFWILVNNPEPRVLWFWILEWFKYLEPEVITNSKNHPTLVWFILDKTLKWVGCVPKMKGPALGKYPHAFLLLANSLPNFDLKKMILTYAKEFSWEKNGPSSPYFEKKKFQITRFSFDNFQ